MLTRFRAAGLLWPTLCAIPVFALLVGLGHWQMSRKAWKDGLVAEIGTRTTQEPRALRPSAVGEQWPKGEPAQYTRVWLRGRFVHEAERHLYAPRPEGPGWLVFTPLMLERSFEATPIVVNRGWVPESLKPSTTRLRGQIEGVVRVVGLVRHPEIPGAFAPANNPTRNTWYWRDISGMLAGIPSMCGQECHRIYIDAEAEPANPGGWPRGGTTNLSLPNRHLEYALTWYGLAATLVAMWGAFVWARLREQRAG